MKQKLYKFLSLKNIGIIYFVVTVAASLHRYFLGYGHYNNYLIFKDSFQHFLQGLNLYANYPPVDLFKYSPTFAVLMSPFAFLPDWLGLTLWNLLNAMLFFYAVKILPVAHKLKVFVLVFSFVELLTSIQNSQSNGLLAALMLLSFTYFESQKTIQTALSLSLAFFIKLFGAATGLCFMFYRKKFSFLVYAVLIAALLFVFPFIIGGKQYVTNQYTQWLSLLGTDQSHQLNFSFQTMLEAMLNTTLNSTSFLIFGVAFLLLPLSNTKQFNNPDYRLLYLCSVLLWTVIFNHKAESPTFVIAVAGLAILFAHQYARRNWLLIMAAAFLLTSLSSTDLFPKFIREEFLKPYRLKALASVCLWLYIQLVFIAALLRGSRVELSSAWLINTRNGKG